MHEIVCNDCGKKMYHENEDTLKIEEAVHKKILQKEAGPGVQLYAPRPRTPIHL